MKTTIKVILIIAWVILLSLIWANMNNLTWQIALTCGWIFTTWILVEMKREPTDEEMTPKR
jgi:uncharacterized protein YebE (UPF0316 family)